MSRVKRPIACYPIEPILELIREEIKHNDYFNRKYFILPDGNVVKISKSLRAYARDGVNCCECGKSGEYFLANRLKKGPSPIPGIYCGVSIHLFSKDGMSFGVDHIIPRSIDIHGGAGVRGNVRVMCGKCNGTKGHKILHEHMKLYRIATVKDILKQRHIGDARYDTFFERYLIDMESRKKTDPYYGFIPYEGMVLYLEKVKELFNLELSIDDIQSNYFPVREEPFKFDFFEIEKGSERWFEVERILDESRKNNILSVPEIHRDRPRDRPPRKKHQKREILPCEMNPDAIDLSRLLNN